MQAHTANSTEGVFACRSWMLSLTEVEVRKGADLPKPPQERGGACRSQVTDAASLAFMQAHASAEMKVCGEPVFRRATKPQRLDAEGPLCSFIRMVKDASWMVAIPFESPGPCSAIGRAGVRNGFTPGAMVDTKIYAGVASGRKGGRSWSNEVVAVGSGVVALIS